MLLNKTWEWVTHWEILEGMEALELEECQMATPHLTLVLKTFLIDIQALIIMELNSNNLEMDLEGA